MVATSVDAERQPLLPRKQTPLPRLQLAIICLVRLAEPVAFTSIFPYINRMVELMNVTTNPADVGWYSGLIDSLFAAAQLLMIYNWARLSDRIGRKPCVLLSITGAATATLLFGLSRNLSTAIFARVMAGFMAGNVAVIESMVGEITDETNQAHAFVLVDIVWYSGSILGTLLGGCLSEPATRLPSIFGQFQLLIDFPFFLPCFVAYSFAMFGVLVGFCWMEETLPRKRRHISSLGGQMTQRSNHVQISAWSLLTDPAVRSILAPFFLLSIQCIGFEVLFTLFSYTSIALGGLNRSPFEIGIGMAFAGFVAVVSHPFAFPWLSKRVQLKKLCCALMFTFPLCYLATPLLHWVARMMSVPVSDSTTDSSDLTGAGRIVLWFLIGLVLLAVRMGGMAFPAWTIILRHATPSPEALGSTFGILHTVGATGRAVGPALVSSLFALTASHHLLGGWFVWLLMACVGITALYLASQVPDLEKHQRKTPQN